MPRNDSKTALRKSATLFFALSLPLVKYTVKDKTIQKGWGIVLPAIILFSLTYVLMISFGKYRPYIALASGMLFVLTGMLPVGRIIGAVWGVMDSGSVKKLQVNMANIRKKLGCTPGENKYFINELGVGYRMLDAQE